MKISDILANRILPFEIEDEKLKKLFSFYLYSAPTIESKSAAMIEKEKLAENWYEYKSTIPENMIAVYSASYPNEKLVDAFERCGLNDDASVNRRTKGFVCKRKEKKKGEDPEPECNCLLRHLRNAIAHDSVYLLNGGNRKYILFEDFNMNNRITARMLFSQADLAAMKRTIMK